MKNYMFIAGAALVLITGCKNPQEDETVVRQRDSLMSVIDEREASVNDFINSFNEIEQDLDVVTSKQHLLLKTSDKEIKANQKDRINEEIKLINELMESNSKKIKDLNTKLSRSAGKNSKLEKTIEILNNQLNQKYSELAELNNRLNSLSAQVAILQIYVDTLSTQNMAQKQTISTKTEELHKAYYVVGTAKELEKSNLIDKKGGLLGIGRTSKLGENLDNTMFTQIDYTQVTSIPINSKDMKIISSHPTDSYTLDKTDKLINSITITNPDKFWSVSKYLVITK